MPERSIHTHTDLRGNRYQVIVETNDKTVVFDSLPPLAFDVAEHRIPLKRSEPYTYSMTYRIENGVLYLLCLEARMRRFGKKPRLYGVAPVPCGNDWYVYTFAQTVCDYTGKLAVGREFDRSAWTHDEKARPVPFAPHVYRKIGCLEFQNGNVTEETWRERDASTDLPKEEV